MHARRSFLSIHRSICVHTLRHSRTVGPKAGLSSAAAKAPLFKTTSHSHSFSRVDIDFMGTGSSPSKYRGAPCTVLNLDKEFWLFDAGEGTDRQLHASVMKYPVLANIFISRLDSATILGLPALVLKELIRAVPVPLNIYGPPGIAQYLHNAIMLFLNQPQVRKVIIHELVANYDPRLVLNDLQPSPAHRSDGQPAELMFPVKQIYPEASGFWRLIDSERVTVLANTTTSLSSLRTSFGFVIREMDKQGSLRMDLCNAMGVPVDAFKALKAGKNVIVGERTISPKDVVTPASPGRKLTIVSTGTDASRLIPAAMDSDVVVHDSCFSAASISFAERLGHATPSLAARFANACRARTLVLTRFGVQMGADFNHTYNPEAVVRRELRRWETPSSNGEDRLFIARDFSQLSIPAGGWPAGSPSSPQLFSIASNYSLQDQPHGNTNDE